jgi:biotin operon repressor
MYPDFEEPKPILRTKQLIKVNEEQLLNKLKQSGKRLKEALGITEEDINRAIKELRRDW